MILEFGQATKLIKLLKNLKKMEERELTEEELKQYFNFIDPEKLPKEIAARIMLYQTNLLLYFRKLEGSSAREQSEKDIDSVIGSHTTNANYISQGKILFENLFPIMEMINATLIKNLNNCKTDKELFRMCPEFIINKVMLVEKLKEESKVNDISPTNSKNPKSKV